MIFLGNAFWAHQEFCKRCINRCHVHSSQEKGKVMRSHVYPRRKILSLILTLSPFSWAKLMESKYVKTLQLYIIHFLSLNTWWKIKSESARIVCLWIAGQPYEGSFPCHCLRALSAFVRRTIVVDGNNLDTYAASYVGRSLACCLPFLWPSSPWNARFSMIDGWSKCVHH